MINIRIFLFLMLLLEPFSYRSLAQTKNVSKKEISNLTTQAKTYLKVNNFEKALLASRLALHYAITAKDDNLIASSYNSIVENYVKLLEYDNATASFLKGMKLGKSEKMNSDLSQIHQEYSKYLLKNEDYKKAYENLALYNKITAELNHKEALKKAAIASIFLELEKYKLEIDKNERKKELQYQSLKKTKIIQGLFLIASFISLLLIYTLYRNNNFKKKTYAKLAFAHEELINAKVKAEEALQVKTQFFSTITHELRTPLYGVVGITNMLLEEHKELEQSPHLSSLKFSAKYLLSLVNDILHINKIEENNVVLESLIFNISDELHAIKNSLAFFSKNNSNRISVKIDPDIPDYLIGDKFRLAQIIMNLVSNALKFTKNGEIMIIANLVNVENKSHYVEFKIKDNGIGIAGIDQDIIFDKFVQVDRKNTDYQGTGLGLSIVKKLLGLFGSAISIESKVGEGTLFSFIIPFEYDPDKNVELINNMEVDLTPSQIYTILVVEDNLINQLVTKKILKKNNYKCVVVDDGFAALEILENERFDVILMDINMPLINGFDTTRRIRHKGIKTPVIALTAFDKGEITEEAISAGINDIITKPFEPLNFFKIIDNMIIKQVIVA